MHCIPAFFLRRRVIGLLILLVQSVPAAAADHVLAVSISRYDPALGISALAGVQQDRKNILQIAAEMGFDGARATQLQDEHATLAGIRREVAELAERVGPGDRVLFYYSGHGSTKQVAQACQASLVTYEGEDYLSSELHAALQRVRDKQPKHLIVMIDACHSGEFTESARHKALPSAGDLQPKMRPRRAGEDTCREPVNVVARSLASEAAEGPGRKRTRRDDLVAGQWVMLSASRDNEVAWDGPKGGAATLATLACIADPELRSAEGNGFVSVDSLSRCVQGKLDATQKESVRQHVVLSGQPMTPLRPERPSQGGPVAANALATLEALARNSDPSWVVLAEPHVGPIRREDVPPPFRWATSNQIRIGGPDRLQISIQSNRTGYLYLVHASRDSNRFSLLYPASGQDHFVSQVGVPVIIPRRWPALGNAGAPEQDAILAIVSDQPMPELHLHLHDATGPATSQVSRQLATASAGVPRKRLGSGEDTSTAKPERRFGAALVLLDEVR